MDKEKTMTDLQGFFKPKSIAVIGASRKEGSLGWVFLDKLLHFGYHGKIFPVNPQATEINNIFCYPTVEDIPEVPELAAVLVKKELAIEAVESCGKKGIKNIIMITAGFREIGGDGIAREEQLLTVIKKYGMRMIGPNCLGIINTDPEVKMNASFSPNDPFSGNVAFVSQSGALGVAVLEMSKTLQLGFSLFISEGNKADLIDSDFLEFLTTHGHTQVVTLYLESIEDTPRFRKIVSQLSRQKPVIVLKAGSSEIGAKAAFSHTGALASSDRATAAFFQQCGLLRVHTFENMFNLTLAFSNQPCPKGNRIAVITNSGGPAILATDAIDHYGLSMAKLYQKTKDQLRKFLPEEASVDNPVDMIASANDTTYQQALQSVLKDQNVDATIIIIVRPPGNTTPEKIAEKFKEVLQKNSDKPIFIVLMTEKDKDSGLAIFHDLHLPVYSYPEAAAYSIAAMLKYQKRRQKPVSKIKRYIVERRSFHHIFESAKMEGREYLRTAEIISLLQAYDFPLAAGTIIQSLEEAVDFYHKINQPLVLKIESDEIIHKSDSGGVKVNLKNPQEITRAFESIMKNAQKIIRPEKITGIFAQEMISGKHELALGMKRDPNYGPMIMVGLGGIFIEIFNDVSFRIAPLSENDAQEMIQEIKGFRILQGFRGSPPIDLEVIRESLLKLSQLSLDWPQISELDLNPFIVDPDLKNCKIVDVRMRISFK
jgi:acetyl coenzyme A synthetase (ADP forming)-like protein